MEIRVIEGDALEISADVLVLLTPAQLSMLCEGIDWRVPICAAAICACFA
jgi:hypothetical protein